MEFCKDRVVAHNASFDAGFIKKNCRDLDLNFDLSIMDIVSLARSLYSKLKKVKLNIISKYLGFLLKIIIG